MTLEIALLAQCREYVQRARDIAESRHDTINSEFYMEGCQWEIMQEADELLAKIDRLAEAELRDSKHA